MQQGIFTQGRILRHILVMTLSSSIGLLAVFFVDLVDMYFISLLGVQELAAAVGYAGSVLFFTLSLNIGLAIGMGALVAKALGGQSLEEARRLITHVSLLSQLIVLPVALGIYVYAEACLSWLGATGQTLVYAKDYLRIIIASAPAMVLAMAGSSILRAGGDAKNAMLVTLSGGIVNAVLDPIFIFTLGLGVQGAAIASVLSRLFMSGYVIYQLVYKDSMFGRIQWTKLGQDSRAFFGVSLPAVLTNLSTPIGLAYITAKMAEFGDSAVAGNAILSKIQPVAFASLFALSGAVGPIIGQNLGARQYTRIKQTFRDGFLFILAYCLCVCSALFFLNPILLEVFQAKGAAADVIQAFCYGLSTMYVFNGMTFFTNAAFNNSGYAQLSTATNVFKATLGTIPFVYLGAEWYGYLGVLYGSYAGTALSAGVSTALSLWVLKRLKASLGPLPAQ